MIKISIQQVKGFFKTDEIMIKKEIVAIRVISTLLAFFFLFSFVFIKNIPVDWLFSAYDFFTSPYFLAALVIASVASILEGLVDKNWSLSILMLILLTGHVMFINVFADKYSLDAKGATIKSEMNDDHLPKWDYSGMRNLG